MRVIKAPITNRNKEMATSITEMSMAKIKMATKAMATTIEVDIKRATEQTSTITEMAMVTPMVATSITTINQMDTSMPIKSLEMKSKKLT